MMERLSKPASYPYSPMHKHYGFAIFENTNEILKHISIAQTLKNNEPDCFITWFASQESETVLQNNPHIDQVVVLEGSTELLSAAIQRLQAERSWLEFFTSNLSESHSSKRILLGQLFSNGDCLYVTTLARQIKHDYPGCHLTWAVSSHCRSVIEFNPFVDDIWEIPLIGTGEAIQNLHQFEQQAIPTWYQFTADVEIRVNQGEFDEVFLVQTYPDNYQYYDGTVRPPLFRAYPQPITVPIQNILRLRDNEVEKVQKFAEQHNLLQRRHVILFECTSRSQQSFVTPDYALYFAQMLLSYLPDCSIILSSDTTISVADERIIDGSVISLRENAELTKYCHLFIGCSSGITQIVLTDWAKPLPIIQLLLASKATYASIAHDLEYWGQLADRILEMMDSPIEQLLECVYTTLTQGFSEAHRRFHQQVPIDFNFYVFGIRKHLLQREQYVEAAKSLLFTVERYGWHPQLKIFLQTELLPRAGVHTTIIVSDEERTKFLQEFLTNQTRPQKVQFPSVTPVLPSTSRPFWSVIIPTYNPNSRYLERALRSILEQDPGADAMQIEVLDDCSIEEDIAAIVHKIGKDRVSFYRQSHHLGTSASWNSCIQRAYGQWVHILPQDDLVLPGFYNRLREAIEQEPCIGAVFCQHININENDHWQSLGPLERETPGILSGFLEQRLAIFNPLKTPGIVVRRSVYEQVGGFLPELTYAADWEMWKRIAAHYPVWYEPQPLVCCREHSFSDTSRLVRTAEVTMVNIRRAIEISEQYLPRRIAVDLSSKSREYFALDALKTARQFIASDEMAAAIAQIQECLICSSSLTVIGAIASLLAESAPSLRLLASVFLSADLDKFQSSMSEMPEPEPQVEFELGEINLIIFPNWEHPEEHLYQELTDVIMSILAHPDSSRMKLWIDNSDIPDEDANNIISDVVFNLIAQEDLDITEEPAISLVGKLSEMQWKLLLQQIQVRIILNNENKAAITTVGAENIPSFTLEELETQIGTKSIKQIETTLPQGAFPSSK